MSSLVTQISDLSSTKLELLARRLREKRESSSKQPTIHRRPESDAPVPLSFAQQRLWFLDQLVPDSPAYNVPTSVRLSGPLDHSILERTFTELLRRHEILRTSFPMQEDQPHQLIARATVFHLPVLDLTELTTAQREGELQFLADNEAQRPFDLERGPLLRAMLVRLADDDHALLFTTHHIISDGWSIRILIKEISAIYAAFAAGVASPLPELPIQYADFAVWQRERLSGEVLAAELDYWRNQLGDTVTTLDLPTDFPRPNVQTQNGARYGLGLSQRLSEQIKELSASSGTTLFMTMLAGFQALLSRYTGQEEIAVGTPIAGRNRAETEPLIGFFVNTLVLRTDLSGDPTFTELLERVRVMALGAYAHQDLPFEKLVEELQPERETGRSPLFQVMMVLQNVPSTQGGEVEGLQLRTIATARETTQFDLVLNVSWDSGDLHLLLEYNTDLFEQSTIIRVLRHFNMLLESVVSNPERRLSELQLVTPEEREQVLVQWNDTASDYHQQKSIHQVFEDQVERAPEALAVLFEDKQVTYKALNERANRLAHHLQSLGVGPDTLVGICVERSVEMVVGLLGILKAGGAYVPIDAKYPLERQAMMLEQVSVLVTDEEQLENMPAFWGPVVCFEEESDWADLTSNPESVVNGENLAYVMYTSGSTGQPKGVEVVQRAVLRLVCGVDYVELNSQSCLLQLAPLTFDASTLELWGALLRGGRCVLSAARVPTPQDLGQMIDAYGVDTMWLTASLYNAVIDEAPESLAGLKQLLIGGEALSVRHVGEGLRRLPNTQIINGYGPTEGTTFTCCYPIQKDQELNRGIPIGRVINNSQVYVLDRKQQMTPVGVVGELYIGGAGLARGYLREAELTAQRFVPHPYSNGERLYRTGDMVRYLEDGRIEFMGRADHQVKVRGYRIELGEIETVLERHGSVREAAVLAREDVPGEKRLVAYVVKHPESSATVTQLLDYVSKKLPVYMVPSAFVMLEQMPLTPNGKIDRRALPAPEHSRPELEQTYVSPRLPLEEIVAGVWAEVLRVEQVGIEDDFFELGGHSLLATQVISRVRELFSIEIELRVLFEQPTVRGLVAVIEERLRGADELAAPAIVPITRDRDLPLSFAQQRLWFLDQLEPGSCFYNIPAAVRLQGELDVEALEQSFREVIRRHELLRTRFGVVNAVPVQVIDEAPEFSLAVLDLSHVAEGGREAEARRVAAEETQKPFDLSTGPMLRATVLRLSEQEHVLLCTMHHIISDGWSMGVLIRELTTLYEAYTNGDESPLPELGIQYADYAYWQREWLQGEVLDKQLGYWKQQMDGAPAVLELPTDYPRPAVQTFNGSHQSLNLPAELTAKLKALTQREGATLFMTLLAAFQTLLSRYSGQEDIVVSTGIANRNRAETEPLIGFFVNTLVLRTDLTGNPSFTELLARVREVTLGAYAHQDVPFELLVEALAPVRDPRYTPLFQVMLVLQNARNGEVAKLDGLRVSAAGGDIATAKFDLTMFAEEQGEELRLVLEYNTDLFAPTTIDQMLASFQRLVAGIVAAPGLSIGSHELIDAEERRRLIGGGSESLEHDAESGELVSVAEIFDAVAARNATAVAIECGERRLSYGELQERANTLANYLITQGARRNSIVALLMADTFERIVGMLGCLKAGAAFMPLDVRQPAARLRKLMELAPPEFLLTETNMVATLGSEFGTLKVMCVDAPEYREYHNPSAPEVSNDPDQLSYIYFTSGSSGTPKAIAGRLKGIAHFIKWEIEELGVDAGVRASQLLSASFDGSLRDIFLPLCVGGTVCVPERHDQILEGRGLVQWLEEEKIGVLHCVPSVFRALVNEELRADELQSLRHIVMAGEALLGKDVGKWKQVYGERIGLLNLYGTSETTMAKFSYRVIAGDEEREVMPIGKPIPGSEAYLLDERGEPCGRGMVGEIYIRTPYRSLGYYLQPELTAAVFVPNPFSNDPTDLVHKTGDMGRVLEDGNFEYLGRRDEQVKVRGARVELKEVENAVRGQAGVMDVAVIEREDASGYTYLCAYLVLADGVQAVTVAEGLAQELPDYMVPSAYVEMDELPRTISGKVDRRALPETGGTGGAAEYAAARTPVEELLVESWERLLGRERIGIDDNFFRLGGHSLLATQVMSRVRESFGVEVGLRVLFERPTVRGLSEVIEEKLRGADELEAPAILPITRDQDLPLSFAQQRLWFLDQLEPGSSFYNIPAAVRLQGELNTTALEQSFQEVIRRHESLRTRFGIVNGVAVQLIDAAPEFSLPLLDLSTVAEGEREAEARRAATAETQKPFDLSTGPLLRASVLRLSEQEHVLLCTMHHIISDGWSMGVLIRELTTLYEAYAKGEESPLPELKIQYADYAYWQRGWLQGEVLDKQLGYWKQQMAGAPEVLELPTDYPRPAVQTFNGAHQSLRLPAELTTELKALTQREGATLFMTLLAAFQTLLWRYSGQEDIVVSTGIANRNRAETEPLIGFFVNTLVLRTDLSGEPSFTELLARVREVTLGAYAHQDVPFELLVEALAPVRDPRYTPLFQVMLVLQNTQQAEAIKVHGLEVSGAGGESGTAKFDLTMFVEEQGEELGVVLEYNTDLFAAATIEEMLESFHRLIAGVVAAPERGIGSVELMDAEERRQLTEGWQENLTSSGEEAELVSVEEMFDAMAARNPMAVAIECGERRLSYGELLERSNTLANYLIEQGAGRESIVALLMADTCERIVGILGTMKAGAAFMPLDVRQPAARLRKLMELAPPEFLLTETQVVEVLGQELSNGPLNVICTDGPGYQEYHNATAPGVSSDPEQLSYIYFTSGSSGTPKAIAGRLKGIGHFIKWEIEQLGAGAGVRASQLLSASFDGSLRDIFLPLCAGGTVCAPERRDQVLEGRGLVQWLEEAQIEVLHCVPSVFRALVNEELRADELQSLRHIVMAGEALLGRDVARWKQVYGERIGLLNLYGTSETTMAKFSYRVVAGDEEREVMPIGKPITGAEAYLLDERGEPCGRGMVGEIYIRTPYRSLGYYKQPELTAAVFVPNPFSNDPTDLVHKTGDMGRVLEDGNFEYLGRRDEQVKVRGARVELKEVENAVRGQAGVMDVAVIEREDASGYTYLCAYLVLAEDVHTVTVAEGLAQELPDYMVPSAYVEMDELPRTISGKIDRRALPETGGSAGLAEYVAPRTPVEELLVESWERLLARERVGIDDNFFRLGGHSLLATQVMSRVRESFGVEVGLRVLFERPTVRALGEVVEEKQRGAQELEAPAITRVSRDGDLVLSFAQQRLWFLDQLEPGSNAYNMGAAVRLQGKLHLTALEQSFREVIRRHESLRTRFAVVNGVAVQVIDEAPEFSLPVVDLSTVAEAEREAQARGVATEETQAPFNLSTGPLLRAKLVKLGEEEHLLLFTMHHIISDGWSMGVLIRELTTLYQTYVQGQPSPLPELKIQYADYAHWQREWLQGEVLEKQLGYWKQQLDGAPPVLELPTDYPRPAAQTFNGAHQSLRLPAELTSELKALTQREGVTLFMTLLAAFQTLLWRYSGQEDIVVSTGIANRNRAETEQLIGFFVNTLLLRTDLSGEPTFRELLARVREVTLGAYAHQDVPFELLVEALAPVRDPRYTPLFQVMLVLQVARQEEEVVKLDGLQVSGVGGESGAAKFDLTLFVEERGEQLGLVLEYNTDLFTAATIDEMLESFQRLMAGIVAAPERSISSLELIDAQERLELIESWS